MIAAIDRILAMQMRELAPSPVGALVLRGRHAVLAILVDAPRPYRIAFDVFRGVS